MSVEDRLVDALATLDRIEPSPDLFARVRRSVAEDRAHRTRVRRASGTVVVATTAAVTVTALASATDPSGVLQVRLSVLAGVEVAVLLALVAALGPVIRRFGSILTATAFAVTPGTDTDFLRLLDVAYYLVFVGYVIVAGAPVERVGWGPLAPALGSALARTAGLLLLMGVMHAATIVALPLVGLLHTSTVRLHRRRAAGASAPSPSPAAERAERVVRILSSVALAMLLLAGLSVAVLALGTTG